MKPLIFTLLAASTLAAFGQKLESVATFGERQVSGVAVAKDGRLFVNFPNWADGHLLSVAEVAKDGSLLPYPNADWNQPEGSPFSRWVCVQSVHVDDTGALWVLDAASPKIEGVVAGGPKLVKFDLTTNQPLQTISFDERMAPTKSYLNDVRVETDTHYAYLTESGLGALLVVDLKTSKVRRVLADHPSTKADPTVTLRVDGFVPTDPKTGKTPQFHADGIALDTKNGYLYFHALTGHTLYRIKTEHLRNEKLDDEALAEKLEKLSETPAPDGMLSDRSGNILLTAIEENAISIWNPADLSCKTLIQDKRLQWPDSLAWGPDGSLYVTTSQIHRTPRFNRGKSELVGPFALWRVSLGKPGVVISNP